VAADDGRPNGGLLVAALDELEDGTFSAGPDLVDPAMDGRRFSGAWAASLLVCLASEVRFGGCTAPRLGLARRGTGSGFVMGST